MPHEVASEGTPRFDRVAVLGLGLMGGSLARALRASASPPVVIGWSPSADERGEAARSGAVDDAPRAWEHATRGADLIVLAMPLQATLDLLEPLAGAAPPDAVVSDVASLKAPVARAAAAAGLAGRWVGAHPMAGSERSGFSASRPDLYADARIWICAAPAAEAHVAATHAFWTALGARPESIDAEAHDRLMAVASHLPQLAANVVAGVMHELCVPPSALGPGGRDVTRLAGSNPAMWREILQHAPPELAAALRRAEELLAGVSDALEGGRLDTVEALMQRGRAWRGQP